MEKEGDYGYDEIIESTEKQAFRIQIPYSLRFAIVWTLFFAIIGITLQIAQSQTVAVLDSIKNFFGQNYIYWIKSFGSFVQITEYNSGMEVFSSIMASWYYFLYTGGLLALIWGVISWIINIEVVIKKRKQQPSQNQLKIQTYGDKEQEISEVDSLIGKGIIFLSEDKVFAAEQIYIQLKNAHDADKNKNPQEYKKILDFYYAIQEKKSRK